MTSLESVIKLIEIFGSVQGETSFTGLPTTFIRLAACNLRCTWCDTTYSFGRGTPYTIQKIIEETEKHALRYVCITGGEPLLQSNVHFLIKQLCDRGFKLSLETGGSLPINEVDPRVKIILDIKCPGSGMVDKNYWENLNNISSKNEVKFVILDRTDYEYAKMICCQYNLYEKVEDVLFSPVHGLLSSQQLVDWIVKDKIPVRLNLQIHKYIWDPLTKGV